MRIDDIVELDGRTDTVGSSEEEWARGNAGPADGEAGVPSAVVERMARRARYEFATVVAEPAAPVMLRRLGMTFSRLSDGGVRVRVLVAPAGTRGAPWRASEPRADERIAVRFARTPVQELLIVDGRTAMVCDGAGMVPATVTQPLYAMFNSVWELSGPRIARYRGAQRTVLDADVLAQLRDGHTDEVAAQHLDISVRTYRRHIARIMQEIGATSRFQAGVLASERGLVRTAKQTPRDLPS